MSFAEYQRDARFAAGIAAKKPFQVLLQVTNRCNMRCSFCDFWPNGVAPKLELQTVDFQKLARDLADIGTFLVSIEGGEPTVRPDLVEIVKALSERHVTVLYTNGWHITEELAKKLFASSKKVMSWKRLFWQSTLNVSAFLWA